MDDNTTPPTEAVNLSVDAEGLQVLLSREFAVVRFSYPLSGAAVKELYFVYSKHRGIGHMTTAHDVGKSDPLALTGWRYTLPGHAARTFMTVKV